MCSFGVSCSSVEVFAGPVCVQVSRDSSSGRMSRALLMWPGVEKVASHGEHGGLCKPR